MKNFYIEIDDNHGTVVWRVVEDACNSVCPRVVAGGWSSDFVKATKEAVEAREKYMSSKYAE